ncbi:uncharacterized protein GLRG_06391 [Colletotrichum graminicola M1.001]|uniref:Uncharacterized protein n=1 Tax=Colletotrichum graminicola (strain M1.001 / M2 / FGSC 10212) TaxID=645133 RepID=E3QK59_COLGM|nr:uncharacterized protein GLRG_06391 [Colletotrichum graminicola M1.001]EFQ31247.1 hypothetical protein GLRG_06391 [Colletotrichum graminicola M1.001]
MGGLLSQTRDSYFAGRTRVRKRLVGATAGWLVDKDLTETEPGLDSTRLVWLALAPLRRASSAQVFLVRVAK